MLQKLRSLAHFVIRPFSCTWFRKVRRRVRARTQLVSCASNASPHPIEKNRINLPIHAERPALHAILLQLVKRKR